MFAIAVNALYTTARKRGTTRQLAVAIVSCVIAALLLLPALLWYSLRFSSEQGTLSLAEIVLLLVYVALLGWVLPLSVAFTYCLFTSPRDSNTSVRLPRPHKRTTRANAVTSMYTPPRKQAGQLAPFVYADDKPWGWLVHRGGRFQGQELALHRSIISLGREEDNDVWLDDDTVSRYHAELAWDKGQVYITDCDSLNGVLLNGRRIRSSTLVKKGDLLEIGSHRFLLKYAEQPLGREEEEDLLQPHLRRSSFGRGLGTGAQDLPASDNFKDAEDVFSALAEPSLPEISEQPTFVGAPRPLLAGASLPSTLPGNLEGEGQEGGVCTIASGELLGRSFLLDRSFLTVGNGSECDITIHDESLSRQHARFLHHSQGDYIQDLASRTGTKVNGIPVLGPCLLRQGDVIHLGEVRIDYSLLSGAHTSPLVPPSLTGMSGPMLLRLPSRPKE